MDRMTSNAPADITNAATKNVKLMTGTKRGLRPYIRAMKEAGISCRVSHGGMWVAPADEMMAEIVRKITHGQLHRQALRACFIERELAIAGFTVTYAGKATRISL